METTTHKPLVKAAIYTRISLDKMDGAGVERQEKECRELAQAHGLEVAAVYSDNSVSAYSGKLRPGFIDMLAAVKAREVAVVLAYAPDRISRNVTEYGMFKARLQDAGARLIYVNGGELDLEDPNADLISVVLSGVSQWESAIKSTRVAAAKRQQRERGKFPRSPQRLFGYEHDGTVNAREAELVRDAATRILAGESLYRISKEWTAAGVTTTKGRRPSAQSIRKSLLSPTIAGFTYYPLKKKDHPDDWESISAWDRLGIVNRDGDWTPILEAETWTALWTHLTNPARRVNKAGSAPRHLLSGIAVCGKCGAPVYARKKWYKKKDGEDPKRVYYCKETGGGHPTRIADPLERWVTALALERLERGDVLPSLARRADDDGETMASLSAQRDNVRQRMRDLEQQATLGNVSMDQFGRMNAALSEQLADLESQLADMAGAGSALTAAAQAEDVTAWWTTATLNMRREIIRALVSITLLPTPGPQHRFNPEHVRVEWLV